MLFPFPAATLDGLVRAVIGAPEQQQPWAPDALAWSVLSELRDLADRPEFAWFRPYLAEDGVVTPRQWGIARQVADVFVRLGATRPRKPKPVDHAKALIDDAVAKGAKVLCGGVPEEGTVMAPTIVDLVTPEMRIYGEESFGPVTTMIRARDTAHAIEIANDTDYGLSAAVFGQDTRRALEVAKDIQSGICHINGPTVFDEAQMPFGGVKSSGYGRFGGTAGINEFTELRWITIEDPGQGYPI